MDLKVINFTNIDKENYEAMWGGETTIIKAGETRQFPKFLAEHYCKHLVNKILIRGGQDWSAENLRKPLEDKILGKVVVEAEEVKVVEKMPEVKVAEKTVEFSEAPPVEKPKRGRKPKNKVV
jgi:hypothetical protein